MRQRLLEFGRRRPLLSGLALVAVVTGLFLLFPQVPPEEWALVHLVAIGITAFYLGVLSAVVAATASTMSLAYIFFMGPVVPGDLGPERSLALLLSFLTVAVLAVMQAAEVRRQERYVRLSAERAHLLADLGVELSRETFSQSLTNRIVGAIMESTGATSVAVFRYVGDDVELRKASSGFDEQLGPVVRDVLRHWSATGTVTDGELFFEDGARVMWQRGKDGSAILPIGSFDQLEGAIFLGPRVDQTFFADADMELVDAIGGMLAMRFEGLRLQAEEAEQVAAHASEQLRSTLVAGVSHELKTPITAAKVSLSGLLRGVNCGGAEACRPALEDASAAVARLEALVGGLLDIALIDADAWPTMMEACELGDIIGTAVAALPPAERARVTIDFPEAVSEVRCEPRQTVRILDTLLGNALAYSPSDAPLTVGVRQRDGWVVTWIQDRGPGVADDEREAIFDRFFRGSASEGRPGTGLGLPIAREIARLHGGDVELADSDGPGARFELRLPVSTHVNGGADE